MGAQSKSKFPSVGQIAAWLGVIATLIGIITGIITISNSLQPKPQGLSPESVAATLGAMQSAKDQAEIQLTQYALAAQQSSNQATQNAINQAQANIQATLTAVGGQQDAFVSTQNALSALTATGQAINATGTQNALNAGLTQGALAQVTPTPTAQATGTPSPAPVADYRSLLAASVVSVNRRQMDFKVQAAQPIPAQPPQGLAYIWLVDTDMKATTGLAVQDIGADLRVAATYDTGTWVGTVRTAQKDGTWGQPFIFVSIDPVNDTLTAQIDPSKFSLSGSFNWVARAELGNDAYPFLPTTGHYTLTP